LDEWFLRYECGQTNKQTYTLITILLMPIEDEVTIGAYIARSTQHLLHIVL